MLKKEEKIEAPLSKLYTRVRSIIGQYERATGNKVHSFTLKLVKMAEAGHSDFLMMPYFYDSNNTQLYPPLSSQRVITAEFLKHDGPPL